MEISNKKTKTILRGWPDKGIAELAQESGLPKRQVKAVLRNAGRLERPSAAKPLAIVAAVAATLLLAWAIHAALTRPRQAMLDAIEDLNVLLITVDTLRADRLGSYGYPKAHTPSIDALAASGVRFSDAHAHQPMTLPSHATILTGTHPEQHGIRDNGLFGLPPGAVTLAEILQPLNFSTGAVISATVLHHQYGLDQGFDHYDDWLVRDRHTIPSGYDEMPANVVSDRAIRWIESSASGRWFLWLHYYDPHSDYRAPRPWAASGVHPYDAEIAFVDHHLGRVLQTLDEKQLRERTLVVFTADHGESLGEHGENSHAFFLYEGVMKVPLIISLPGAVPSGAVRHVPSRLIDVAPTILDVVGVERGRQMQGRSLVPFLYSELDEGADFPIAMETMAPWFQHGWSPSRALIDDQYKYIEAPTPELYDLERDPMELQNLLAAHQGRADAMAVRLEKLRRSYQEAGMPSREARELDDEAYSRLARLGYVFAGPSGLSPSPDAPDVKSMVGALGKIDRANVLRARGKVDEAVALLEGVLQESPGDRQVLNQLGVWLSDIKQYERARAYLEQLVDLHPDFSPAYLNLSLVYLAQKRLDQAREVLDSLLELKPGSAKAHTNYGLLEIESKNPRAALDHLSTAIELYPNLEQAHYNLGRAYLMLGDVEKALRAFKDASAIKPENAIYRRSAESLEALLQGAASP